MQRAGVQLQYIAAEDLGIAIHRSGRCRYQWIDVHTGVTSNTVQPAQRQSESPASTTDVEHGLALVETQLIEDQALGFVELRPGNPVAAEVTYQLIRLVGDVAAHDAGLSRYSSASMCRSTSSMSAGLSTENAGTLR